MDTSAYLLTLSVLFQLGVIILSNAEDSACGNEMSCVSLEECTYQLQSQQSEVDFLFKCSNENKKVCCPSGRPSERYKDTYYKMEKLSNDVCGRNIAHRIIGGDVASLGQFPWMALLGARLSNGSLLYICGGSLISDQYILTAAHCLQITNATLEVVRLGEHNLTTEKDCEDYCSDPVQDYQIEKIIPHEKFDSYKIKNDIALLKLKTKVPKYTEFIRPICLPFGLIEAEKEEKVYEIAGWGKTDFYDSHGSAVLRFAKVFSTPLEDCNTLQAEQVKPLTDTQLCAGGTRGEDACKGDSGGPLMDPQHLPGRVTTQYYQVGIVSFGAPPCGSHSTPSVYTRVSAYLDWILDRIQV